MKKQVLGSFQLFALCALSSVLGVFVTTGKGFSPMYFWLTVCLYVLQSVSILLLGLSFSRTEANETGEHFSYLFSAPVARILLVILGVLLLSRSALTLSAQTDCIALYLLEDTPDFAVMLLLLLTAYAALLPGLRRLSGVSTLLVLILPLLILLISASGLISADWGEIRVLAQPVASEFGNALLPAALTASGAECTLFFLGRERSEHRSLKGAAAAPAVCGLIFILLSLTAVGTIGLGGMSFGSFPLIEASRQISLGGIELTERFDLPLITVSLFASVVQMAIFTLCSALSLCAAFRSRKIGQTAAWLLPVQFALSLFIQYTGFDSAIQYLCAGGLTVFAIIIYPLLYLLSLLRRPIPRQENTV